MCKYYLIFLGLLINYETMSKVSGFGNIWSKLQPGIPASTCNDQSIKLLSLLNLLCNTTQTTSITNRDACYGCFFRAGSLTGGSTQLIQLSQCANMYLMNSNFSICATQLTLIANGTNPTTAPSNTFCYTGYCEFVRCVRRINSNTLIDSCFMENIMNYDINMSIQRINFYTNVTSCILAKSRCSTYNPISGQLQQQQRKIDILEQSSIYQYGKPSIGSNYIYGYPYQNYYNSLQISKNGDIRLITFPSTINVADLFCSRVTTLEQSNYGIYSC